MCMSKDKAVLSRRKKVYKIPKMNGQRSLMSAKEYLAFFFFVVHVKRTGKTCKNTQFYLLS